MRKTLLTLLTFAVSLGLSAAKPRKISFPYFSSITDTNLDVVGVTLSDTATTVDFICVHTAGVLQISGNSALVDAGGRRYAVRRAEGLALNQPVYSGDGAGPMRAFSLIFDPVPLSVREISFTENPDTREGWNVCHIRLDGKRPEVPAFPGPFSARASKAGDALPEPDLTYGEARLEGRFLGWTADCPLPLKLTLYGTFASDYDKPLIVNPDGTFALTLPVAGTAMATLTPDFGIPYRFFLEAGKTTELCFNLPEFCRRDLPHADKRPALGDVLHARGPLAALTEALADGDARRIMASEPATGESGDYDSYRRCIADWSEATARQITALKAPRMVKEYLSLDLGAGQAGYLQNAPYNILLNNLLGGVWTNAQSAEKHEWLKKNRPADLFPAQATAGLDRPQALLTKGLKDLVRKFPAGEMTVLARSMPAGGFFSAVQTAGSLIQNFDQLKPLNDSTKTVAETLPATFAGIVRGRNAEVTAHIEALRAATEGRLLQAPDSLMGDTLLAHILAPHRGRTVMIDLWATWCGPCKAGIKAMPALEEEFKDEPVDYIYLTNHSSPEPLWRESIVHIHGQHYRLNDAQWKSITEKFGFRGIPAYLFVDTEGRVVEKQLGYGTIDHIRYNLLKALGAKPEEEE